MKALRHFEALFLAIAAIACTANYFVDDSAIEGSGQSNYAAALPAMTPGMHVVVIAAKRMSEAEKQASLAEERKAAQASNI